jgi:hypothetical protein
MEKINIPEINSLNSMEGLENDEIKDRSVSLSKDEQEEIDRWKDLMQSIHILADEVKLEVQNQNGMFNFFSEDFWASLDKTETEKKIIEKKAQIFDYDQYFSQLESLDCFEMLKQKGLVDENLRDVFDRWIPSGRTIEIIVSTKRHIRDNEIIHRSNIPVLVYTHKQVSEICSQPNIAEINEAISHRMSMYYLSEMIRLKTKSIEIPKLQVLSSDDWKNIVSKLSDRITNALDLYTECPNVIGFAQYANARIFSSDPHESPYPQMWAHNFRTGSDLSRIPLTDFGILSLKKELDEIVRHI